MFSIREIFDVAIQIEKNGEKFYRDALEKISNPSLRSLLEWMADQEAEHQSWFSEKKETVRTKVDDVELEEMGRTILQNILGDQTFSLKEADLPKIEDVEALLQLCIEFEKDTILFYEMIGSFIEDTETSEKLDEIIEEENRHIKLLEDFEEKEEIG